MAYHFHRFTKSRVQKNLLLPSMILGGITTLLFSLPLYAATTDSLQALHTLLENHPLLAPLLFLLVYTLIVPLLLPGTLLCLLGGALFGPWLGGILNVVGATMGGILAFLIARHLAADFVERRLGKKAHRFKRGIEQQGWRFVALVRLIPVVPYDLSNYAFGLTHIPLTQFSLATALCLLPRLTAYAYIGHSGITLISEEGDRLLNLISITTLVIAVLLLPYLYGRIRQPLKT